MAFAPLTYLPSSLKPVSQGSLVTEDHGEVCPLSGGVMLLSLNPYPIRYRSAFACSPIPLPQPPRLPLRVAFRIDLSGSVWETTELTRSANVIIMRGLGSVSAPVGRHLRQGSSEPLDLPTCHFGPSVFSSLRLFLDDGASATVHLH
jgi:hypothetical protein